MTVLTPPNRALQSTRAPAGDCGRFWCSGALVLSSAGDCWCSGAEPKYGGPQIVSGGGRLYLGKGQLSHSSCQMVGDLVRCGSPGGARSPGAEGILPVAAGWRVNISTWPCEPECASLCASASPFARGWGVTQACASASPEKRVTHKDFVCVRLVRHPCASARGLVVPDLRPSPCCEPLVPVLYDAERRQ